MNGPILVGDEEEAAAVAQEHGGDDAEDGDKEGGEADAAEVGDIGFEADLEEEQDDADAGQVIDGDAGEADVVVKLELKGLAVVDLEEVEPVEAAEGEVAEQDADDEFAEDGGLSDLLEEVAAKTSGQDDDEDAEQDRGDGVGVPR